MASHTFSTSDLRSAARGHNRSSSQRHKWALGAVDVRSRPGNPRPMRFNDIASNLERRSEKAALSKVKDGNRVDPLWELDMEEDTIAAFSGASDSASDLDENAVSPAAEASVMFSYDAAKGPSHGSEILNLALAKAEERFKDKETAKLVKSEYDVLDTQGELIGLDKIRKGKGKSESRPNRSEEAEEEDYEFV